MNILQQWIEYGQSYWLDNLTRDKITGGELEYRVKDQGLRGITSNPSIFNKAITNSNAYDDQIRELVRRQAGPGKIYEELTVKDVQDACDILKPVYDHSDGVDGFVSLEVSPYLARDTKGTISEARRLFRKVGRKNCFIKIPGTPEGLPAIEQMLYEGVNINITLIFSVDRYAEVAETYIRAMERRQEEGLQLDHVRCVASIFLSRIDVLVDQLLGHKIVPSDHSSDLRSENLFGQAGIATAKLAYQRFKEIFSGQKWVKLHKAGAKVQRPLWASTSTKNPLYSDIRYVESLIARQTVNTLPDETIDAFAGHGTLKEDTIEENAAESGHVFNRLKQLGIDIGFVTQQLENEGIQKFIDPYDKLMVSIAEKRMKILGTDHASLSFELGKMENTISNAFAAMNEKQAGRRIFHRDSFYWKADEITDFAKTIGEAGYKHAILMGLDIKMMLASANQMLNDCDPYVPAPANPGLALGTIMGMCQRLGRDKITFFLSESIADFGTWVVQLIAEGTGRKAKGLVPVTNDPAGSPEDYNNDRLFIYMHVPSDNDEKQEKIIKTLAGDGHPLVRITVPDKNALGGEYYRWVFATAVAEVVMDLNPFMI